MEKQQNTPFGQRLTEAVIDRGTPAMVGIDPRWDLLPEEIREGSGSRAEAFRRFSCEVIDAVAPLVPIVKPQAAFFEQLGPEGMTALHAVIQHARHSGLLVILDAKRGDIGSTAQAYAEGILGPTSAWGADAVTVNPYLGSDSVQPFVDVARQRCCGVFVLVKTSNPGGGELQDLEVDARTIYRRVADMVRDWNLGSGDERFGPIGAVVGATYPAQLAELRAAMPGAWLLVPGYGSQGGTSADVAGAFHEAGLGAVINSSRGILFAHTKERYATAVAEGGWQRAVEAATLDMIEDLRTNTPAGALKP